MRVYDAFPFFNELDLLELRLRELAGVVDRFVLVEATRTYRGAGKALHFGAQRERFAAFHDRIIHVVVDDLPVSDDPWVVENFQRNAILRGLVSAEPTDLIIISDVDEIPNPAVVAAVLAESGDADLAGKVIGLRMRMFYYSLNWEYETYWDSSRIVTLDTLRALGATQVREGRPHRVIEGAGWHFSYLARGAERRERLQLKARSFAHAEYDTPEYLDAAYLDYCLTRGFRWCDDRPFDTRFRYRRIDDTYPRTIQQAPSDYADFCSAPPRVIHRLQASLRHTPAVVRQARWRLRGRAGDLFGGRVRRARRMVLDRWARS